ncbi:MAG: hypothetical protein H6747_09955 [Deltaproteobacteria bacterium]|nr:hypothetical protein [Deltaproteobacteria bacterium]
MQQTASKGGISSVRAITLEAQGKDATAGEAVILELDEAARGKRARKAAGICVAIAVGSLAIPLVHFVAPWAMLIVATVVYRKIMAQGAELERASGPCPACGHGIEVPRQALEWPIEWNCDGCRKRLVLQPAAEAAEGAAP